MDERQSNDQQGSVEDRLINPRNAEKGRTQATLIAALTFVIVLMFIYFFISSQPDSSQKNLILNIIPSLIVVIIAFMFLPLSRILGLWKSTDRLDTIVRYLDDQMQARRGSINVYLTMHEVPWSTIFSAAQPINFFCNFATLPLRQGGDAIRKSLTQLRAGHLFVFLDPDAGASVEILGRVRSQLSFANTPDSAKIAIEESLALLVELLPSTQYAGNRPYPGVRVILAKRPLPYSCQWNQDWLVIVGHEIIHETGLAAPRMVLRGETGDSLRIFSMDCIRDIIEGGAQEPTLHQLIALGARQRNKMWAKRMNRRLVR